MKNHNISLNYKRIGLALLINLFIFVTIVCAFISDVNASYRRGGTYYAEIDTTAYRYDKSRTPRHIKSGTRIHVKYIDKGWGLVEQSNGVKWTLNMSHLISEKAYLRRLKKQSDSNNNDSIQEIKNKQLEQDTLLAKEQERHETQENEIEKIKNENIALHKKLLELESNLNTQEENNTNTIKVEKTSSTAKPLINAPQDRIEHGTPIQKPKRKPEPQKNVANNINKVDHKAKEQQIQIAKKSQEQNDIEKTIALYIPRNPTIAEVAIGIARMKDSLFFYKEPSRDRAVIVKTILKAESILKDRIKSARLSIYTNRESKKQLEHYNNINKQSKSFWGERITNFGEWLVDKNWARRIYDERSVLEKIATETHDSHIENNKKPLRHIVDYFADAFSCIIISITIISIYFILRLKRICTSKRKRKLRHFQYNKNSLDTLYFYSTQNGEQGGPITLRSLLESELENENSNKIYISEDGHTGWTRLNRAVQLKENNKYNNFKLYCSTFIAISLLLSLIYILGYYWIILSCTISFFSFFIMQQLLSYIFFWAENFVFTLQKHLMRIYSFLYKIKKAKEIAAKLRAHIASNKKIWIIICAIPITFIAIYSFTIAWSSYQAARSQSIETKISNKEVEYIEAYQELNKVNHAIQELEQYLFNNRLGQGLLVLGGAISFYEGWNSDSFAKGFEKGYIAGDSFVEAMALHQESQNPAAFLKQLKEYKTQLILQLQQIENEINELKKEQT